MVILDVQVVGSAASPVKLAGCGFPISTRVTGP